MEVCYCLVNFTLAAVFCVFSTVSCCLLLKLKSNDAKNLTIDEYVRSLSREQQPSDWESESTCAICLVEFEADGDKVAQLPCNNKHIFHTQCILKWVEHIATCPMCRTPIKVSNA